MVDKAEVKEGSKVSVDYTGTLDNGEVFDTSEGREPLVFTVGEGKIIKGFDSAVRGMKIGEEKTVKIAPEEAYGPRVPELEQVVPKEALSQINKEGIEIQEGMTLAIKGPNGEVFPCVIKSIKDDKAVLDLNHPLAGKTLTFKIKLTAVE